MANLVLAFGEVLVGAVLLDAGIKGDSIANVVKGQATPHPLPGQGTGSSSSSGGSGSPVISGAGYVNPFPGASASRVDQGVDYTTTKILAPANSKILIANASDPGWKGGGYIAAQILDGPLKNVVYYVAEGLFPTVKPGDTVAAGSSIGSPIPNPYNGITGNIEAGWANPSSPGAPLAQSTGGYSEGSSTAAGASFNRFIQGLGGVLGTMYHNVLGSVSGMGLP